MPSYETAGFHAQQASEKALKALLAQHQREIPGTHDIGELLHLADEVAPGIAAALSDAEVLSTRAVTGRYPTAAPPMPRDVAAQDLDRAARVVDYVRRVLGRDTGAEA